MKYNFTERVAWRNWVTPKTARKQAVHRWYLFPHSFTGDIVHALIDEWGLGKHDRILDPFIGSGTTLLAAQEAGIASDGYDLSPLAVLASNTKTFPFIRQRLETAWTELELALNRSGMAPMRCVYPELVRKALPDGRLEALDAVLANIANMNCSPPEQDFFRLALVSIIPRFSHALATGGWLSWLNQGDAAENVTATFKQQVEMMLSDMRAAEPRRDRRCEAQLADARTMPAADDTYAAVITSPPYPNRHDYTRVFGVELLFAFHDWETNRALRYQTFHSHPEARPDRPSGKPYQPPKALDSTICNLSDKRMQHMLSGYFLDMYLCLCEVARVCRKGGRAAFVIGNTQYDGIPILVDEFTAEVGEQAGLVCQEIRALRWRGNSAQQMGKYGRMASRESIVMFEKQRETSS